MPIAEQELCVIVCPGNQVKVLVLIEIPGSQDLGAVQRPGKRAGLEASAPVTDEELDRVHRTGCEIEPAICVEVTQLKCEKRELRLNDFRGLVTVFAGMPEEE